MTGWGAEHDSKELCKSINSYRWTAGGIYTFIYAIPVIDLWTERVVNESFTQPIAVLFDQFNIPVCWWRLDFMDTNSLIFVWTI